MDASHKGVHYYHADACPVGGYVTAPFDSILHSHGSVSLSPTGGHVAARVEDFKLDTVIFGGPAYSQASGSIHKATGNWTTQVTSVVENLSVYEVVTADKIVAQLSIEHPRDGSHPSVSFVGSQFENLRINGKPVDAGLDHALLSGKELPAGREGQYSPAATAVIKFPDRPWNEVPGFTSRIEAKSQGMTNHEKAPQWLKNRYQWVGSREERTRRGFTLCSLVEEVKGTAPDSTFGHVIHVPGFGNVFLGELIVTGHSFQLTMLRIEMGCLADGNLSFASGRGNGIPMP